MELEGGHAPLCGSWQPVSSQSAKQGFFHAAKKMGSNEWMTGWRNSFKIKPQSLA
jgi:hypothetical protein